MAVSKCVRSLLLLVCLLLGSRAGQAQPHKYSNLFRTPPGLDTYFDYTEAVAAARQAGKPLLIEFTGHATINARRIEQNVWPDSAVFPLLRHRYVILQVYVDDATPLPKLGPKPAGSASRAPQTLGAQWAAWQQTQFGTNYQPYYVALNPTTERRLLPSLPIEALSDPAKLAEWLRAGVAALPAAKGK
jgi:thiol:disulfide interchange protein DsbD